MSIAKQNRKALIVLTNHDQLGDTGRSTGFYLSEAAHPHKIFTDAGYQVEFASPAGGNAPMDGIDRSDPVNAAFLDDDRLVAQTKNTAALGDLTASDYEVIFFAGGHGTMWDFPNNAAVAKAAAEVYESGGVVAAVCHGPASLVDVKLSDGSYLVAGREVTGFTNEEEARVELTEVVPFLLESRLKDRGATFRAGEVFGANVVVSGRLYTGQNPASATPLAERIVEAVVSDASGV